MLLTSGGWDDSRLRAGRTTQEHAIAMLACMKSSPRVKPARPRTPILLSETALLTIDLVTCLVMNRVLVLVLVLEL